MQIGEIKVPIKDVGKEPMEIEKSVDVPLQKPVMANDHEVVATRVQRTSTISLGGALQA